MNIKSWYRFELCLLCFASLLSAGCLSEGKAPKVSRTPVELGVFSPLQSKFSQDEIEEILILLYKDQIKQAETTLASVIPANPRYLLHLEDANHIPDRVLAAMKRTESVEDYALRLNKVQYILCSVRSVDFESPKVLAVEMAYVYIVFFI